MAHLWHSLIWCLAFKLFCGIQPRGHSFEFLYISRLVCMLTAVLHCRSCRNISGLHISASIETGLSQHICCPEAFQPKSLHARKHAPSTASSMPTRNVSRNVSEHARYIRWKPKQLSLFACVLSCLAIYPSALQCTAKQMHAASLFVNVHLRGQIK